jgi:riboflavin synthase
MFTGIIKETGTIEGIIDRGGDREFKINAGKILKEINTGDSISINGVCLTVKSYDSHSFNSDISSNTLKYTNFDYARKGDLVNLEPSLSPKDRIGGHFLSGHIDGVAKIADIKRTGRSFLITFKPEIDLSLFIAERGSIAIDGISLTVTEAGAGVFKTVIIPHTFENTTLGRKGIGETVNIEVDMIARYIVNYLSAQKAAESSLLKINDKILKEKLEENGFI